jgi:hypothetical protein
MFAVAVVTPTADASVHQPGTGEFTSGGDFDSAGDA